MTFRVGDRVRVSVGPFYGRVGRIIAITGTGPSAVCHVGGISGSSGMARVRHFLASDLLPGLANNGD